MFKLFKEKPLSHDFKLAILVISGALLEDCKLPEWDLWGENLSKNISAGEIKS